MKTDIESRLRHLAVGIIRMLSTISYTTESNILKQQLIKSIASTASGYRLALKAKEEESYYARLETCLVEVDQSQFWLEIMGELGIGSSPVLKPLINQCSQLMNQMEEELTQNAHKPEIYG